MEIHLKIKNIREQRNYTQDYVSYELGITQPAYSKIESGKSDVSFKQLEKICDILEIGLIDLLNFNIIKKYKNNMMVKNVNENLKSIYEPILNKLGVNDTKVIDKITKLMKNFEIGGKIDESNVNVLVIIIKLLSKINLNSVDLIFDDSDSIEPLVVSIIRNKSSLIINNTNALEIINNIETLLIDDMVTILNSKSTNKLIIGKEGCRLKLSAINNGIEIKLSVYCKFV